MSPKNILAIRFVDKKIYPSTFLNNICKVPAPFFLETGENMHTRLTSLKSKFGSKPLHIRKGSAFYIIMVNEHLDKILDNRPIDLV